MGGSKYGTGLLRKGWTNPVKVEREKKELEQEDKIILSIDSKTPYSLEFKLI